MNAYEEYKTIIMAKFNTATARPKAVCWDVYRLISMYEYMTASVNWYRGYCYRLVTVVFAINDSRRSCKLIIPCRLNR